MKDQLDSHHISQAEVREKGWAAESRDAAGTLHTTHLPFETDEKIAGYVREQTGMGRTVTFFPALMHSRRKS